MIWHLDSSVMSDASFRVVSFFAMAGALPPALEVVKNTGSMWAKSPSSCMRCIRTEPTIPRQPTKPTKFIVLSLKLNRVHHTTAFFPTFTATIHFSVSCGDVYVPAPPFADPFFFSWCGHH